jgi:hypothetical protein
MSHWVRSFLVHRGPRGGSRAVARARGLKTMVGAWIGRGPGPQRAGDRALVALAARGMVDIATVGNEVLLRGDLTEPELLACIRRVRAALPPQVLVGCVDAYGEFLDRPALVEAPATSCCPTAIRSGRASDIAHASAVLGAHAWRWCAGLRAASRSSSPRPVGPARGSRYRLPYPRPCTRCATSSRPRSGARRERVELFYFSSFDEPWKRQQEGEVGAHWGLWDEVERPSTVFEREGTRKESP